MQTQFYYGTGRRKTSVARVRLYGGGEGAVSVNDRNLEEFFTRDTLRNVILRPLVLTDRLRLMNVKARVDGGGATAQAGALSHGISRALLRLDPNLRAILKKEGLLTRDDRMKERKKYGQKGARKRFQYSKR